MRSDVSPKYDVVFISYKESNSDQNWLHLKRMVGGAKRVHGVDGILNAHKAAAQLSETDFLFVIDGDNYILPEFRFNIPADKLDEEAVYVWRARNPVNGLIYGYGGVKLYPKKLLLSQSENVTATNGDLATNASRKYVVVEEVASETRFNASPLEAWRGAFREVIKLSINLKNNQGDSRTEERLGDWLTKGKENSFGEWAIAGAEDGYRFFQEQAEEKDIASYINNFEWLNERFLERNKKARESDYLQALRLLQAIEVIYGPQSHTMALKEILKILSNGNDNHSLDFAIFQFLESLSDMPSLEAVKNLKMHPKNFISQMNFAEAFSKKSLFQSLKELRRNLLLSDNPWNISSQSIRMSSHFPEEIREDLAVLIKEDFSESVLFKIYGDLINLGEYEHLKLILDLRNSQASERDKLKTVLKFLISLYDDKNIRDLRDLICDPKQAVPAVARIVNNLNTSWLTHGIRRLAHEEWPEDFIGSLSVGQLRSKLWLINEIKPFMGINESCVIMGGWFAVLAALFFEKMPEAFRHILSLDKDPSCEPIANQLNVKARIDGGRFWAITRDMYDFKVDNPGLDFWPHIKFDWVINTSCEHLERIDHWLDEVPRGTKMVLQSNNFFSHKEHVNCVSSLDEFLRQTALSKIFYSGELKLPKYDRFMIIGEK